MYKCQSLYFIMHVFVAYYASASCSMAVIIAIVIGAGTLSLGLASKNWRKTTNTIKVKILLYAICLHQSLEVASCMAGQTYFFVGGHFLVQISASFPFIVCRYSNSALATSNIVGYTEQSKKWYPGFNFAITYVHRF